MLIRSHKPTPVHNILYDFITDDDINDVDDDVGGMVGICVITGVLIPGLSMGINTGILVTIRQLLTLPHWTQPGKYVGSHFVYFLPNILID